MLEILAGELTVILILSRRKKKKKDYLRKLMDFFCV
jgi:hypothetical protein